MHLIFADHRNWGQPLLVGGPAAQQALQETKKAAEAIANANQKLNEIQSLTPEGQLKKIVKQELAKQQNKDLISGDPPSAAEQAAQDLAGKAIDAVIDEATKPAPSEGGEAAKNSSRTGRQERLRQLGNDPNVSSADRGWIKNEERQIEKGNRDTIRNPPGRDLAHERGREAAKGYNL